MKKLALLAAVGIFFITQAAFAEKFIISNMLPVPLKNVHLYNDMLFWPFDGQDISAYAELDNQEIEFTDSPDSAGEAYYTVSCFAPNGKTVLSDQIEFHATVDSKIRTLWFTFKFYVFAASSHCVTVEPNSQNIYVHGSENGAQSIVIRPNPGVTFIKQ